MNVELMKKRRKELGMTQQDLADKCGLSRVTILNYENGRFEPTEENIKLLSNILDIPETELLTSDENVENYLSSKDFLSTAEIMRENLIGLISFEINPRKINSFDFDYLNSRETRKELDIFRFKAEKLLDFLEGIFSRNMIFSYKLKQVILYDEDFQDISTIDEKVFCLMLQNILSITKNTLDNSTNIKKNPGFEFARMLFLEEKAFGDLYKEYNLEKDNKYKLKKIIRKLSNSFRVFEKSDLDITIEALKDLRNEEGGSDE